MALELQFISELYFLEINKKIGGPRVFIGVDLETVVLELPWLLLQQLFSSQVEKPDHC